MKELVVYFGLGMFYVSFEDFVNDSSDDIFRGGCVFIYYFKRIEVMEGLVNRCIDLVS